MSRTAIFTDDAPFAAGTLIGFAAPDYNFLPQKMAARSNVVSFYLALMEVCKENETLRKEIMRAEVAKQQRTKSRATSQNKVEELGWAEEETLAVRNSMASFETLWNAPGMEAYDDL